jgi:hypothetical protein
MSIFSAQCRAARGLIDMACRAVVGRDAIADLGERHPGVVAGHLAAIRAARLPA